eukprot:GHVL01010877.1.p1 GENE.GHVL01010877.1~~GHVL01010877.1.p1  ORF type:complete len:149 (+),score=17.54 GHVL01010877.1:273-719(+)
MQKRIIPQKTMFIKNQNDSAKSLNLKKLRSMLGYSHQENSGMAKKTIGKKRVKDENSEGDPEEDRKANQNVSYMDRCKLSTRMASLSPEQLGNVVKIFQQTEPSAVREVSSTRLVLDIDSLTTANYRIVAQFVRSALREQIDKRIKAN